MAPDWLLAWEAREEALALERFRQYAGLPFDEARMIVLAREIQDLCADALHRVRRGDVPDTLFFAMVANRAAAEVTALENETYRLRNEAVRVTVSGEDVNLGNVRLFNHRHARDDAVRRRAFEEIMQKARVLTPVLRRRFEASLAAHEAFGLTPLDAYLGDERVTLQRLVAVVDDAARRARPEFERLVRELTPQALGKDAMEAHDDMYVYRHVVYAPVDAAFRHVDPSVAIGRTARDLGLPVDAVAVDAEPRPGKYASPVCFGVRIPGDVRVLYQRTSPFGDYESFYHEMGHGLHFASVDASRPFHERRLIPNGVAEIFSTLFEELAMRREYLVEDVGLAPDAVDDVLRRRRFMELFFLVFYGANSMHKVRFWRDGLVRDFDAADDAYADLTEAYMGVRVPGIYWQTHHILSMSDVYAPSYLLANVRKSELVRVLEREFGDRWWRRRDAGDFLRERCMAPGGGLDLDAFSRLDANAYLASVVAA